MGGSFVVACLVDFGVLLVYYDKYGVVWQVSSELGGN